MSESDRAKFCFFSGLLERRNRFCISGESLLGYGRLPRSAWGQASPTTPNMAATFYGLIPFVVAAFLAAIGCRWLRRSLPSVLAADRSCRETASTPSHLH